MTSDPSVVDTRSSRRTALAAAIGISVILVPLLIGAIFYVQLKPPTVSVTRDSFVVRCALYHEEIPIGDIAEVSLETTIPHVLRRTNGFAAAQTLRGHFTLEGLGNGELFITRTPPYVVVRTPGSFVIVNFEDPERTRDLYEDLRLYVTAR